MITFWFALVVLAWVLYFVLEGFDFGVGILAPLLGRDDHERGAAIRTVGPFWDGNEVWLVAAIGVTFAAFPAWYAALLSGLYLPFALVLLLLAIRGVALEFRGKHSSAAWRRRAEWALFGSSAGVMLLWGALLAVFARGLALDAAGSVTGSGLSRSLGPLGNAWSLLGAALALGGAVLLGATFLGLRTTGPVRRRARRVAVGAGLFLAVLTFAAGWAMSSRPLLVGAMVALGVTILARAGRESTAFVGTAVGTAFAVAMILTSHGDVVLPSTLNEAWSLTRTSAAATDSTLRLLTMAGLIILPGVLAYQAYSYWVFRRRVASERIPS
ncbi:cytochrome d ubiquinol oxidase subunit II [Actinoplanes sp. NPDC051470]|uniref:cytochrome d ubiquinol oxidase subunit II n=1 Tax=unclassified Actinoplanes TaxID=2626549 RepID=UPI00341D9D0A